MADTKTIKATWTIKDLLEIPKVDTKTLSEEEQADLIVERLSKPYQTPEELLEEKIAAIMSEVIREEIDAEILKKVAIPEKNLNNTTLTQSYLNTLIQNIFKDIK